MKLTVINSTVIGPMPILNKQDPKNNTELHNNRMKTTWKTYEETMRQAETGLSRPKL
jgi:hypothetical protein